ncbi:MAG TPA: efflux RND transporter periplasmic adaptor subunit [Chloroflexota bacterium]|nr:efflux RND transporter periplasmic adaptor subunit [Chloroflexota bacterium]
MGVATRVWMRRGARPPIHAAGAERRITPGLLLALLLGLTIGIAGAYVVTLRLPRPPAVTAPSLPGLTTPARRGPMVVTLQAAGMTVPDRQARLGPRQPGTLTEVDVKPGDAVQAGAVLARTDTSKLESKLEQAKSDQRAAQLKLDQINAGPRPEEVTQAEANVQGAQAKLADAVAGPPAPNLAAAQAEANAATAQLRSAQQKLDVLTGGKAPDELRQAVAESAKAQAELQRAQGQLSRVTTGGTIDEQKAQTAVVQELRRTLQAQLAGKNLACAHAGGACEAAKAAFTKAQQELSAAEAKLQALKTPGTQQEIDAATAQVEQARQAAQQANLKVQRLQSGNLPTDAEIKQAQAEVEQATAQRDAAQAKVDAMRQGPSAGQVQQAQSQLIGAQAQLALKRQPTTPQEVAMAQEQLRKADIAVKDAQADLDGATIVAPFNGVVASVNANVGDQVGSSPIITLIDPSVIRVEIGLDETEVRRIAVGSPARVTFVPTPDQVQTAKVTSIAADPTMLPSGLARYSVLLTLDDQNAVPRPGTGADVTVLVAQKDDTLQIPASAVARVGGDRLVAVVVDGKPEVRPVKVGMRTDQMVEVTDGLKEGDEVIVPAPQALLGSRLGSLAIPTPPAVPTGLPDASSLPASVPAKLPAPPKP